MLKTVPVLSAVAGVRKSSHLAPGGKGKGVGAVGQKNVQGKLGKKVLGMQNNTNTGEGKVVVGREG